METHMETHSYSAKILTQNVLKRQILTATLAKIDTHTLYFTSYLIPIEKLLYF